MESSQDSRGSAAPLTSNITIVRPIAGLKAKVKASYGATSGDICVLGKAVKNNNGPIAVWAIEGSFTSPTPAPSAEQGECVFDDEDINFIVDPVSGVGCNEAGTVDNTVTVWVQFGAFDYESATVSFKGQRADEKDCADFGDLDTGACT